MTLLSGDVLLLRPPPLWMNADNEPRQLYNLTQFIISDKEGRGVMTLQDAMQILYLRHGRAQLDEQLVKLFGTSDLRTGKVLTLREFLHALHSQQASWRLAKQPICFT
jgi:hypothetical protein